MPSERICELPAHLSLSSFTWRCYHNTNDSPSVHQRAEPPLLKHIMLHKRGFSQGCTKLVTSSGFFFNSDTVIAKKGPSTLLISDAGRISKRVWERWWWNKTLYCPRESNPGIAVTLSGLSRNELVWNFINKGTDQGPSCSWVLPKKLTVTQLVK